MKAFLVQISSLVCHQFPSKTFNLNELFMPLCSRCTGIYTGFLIALIFQLVLGSRKRDKLPFLGISLLSIFFILLMPIHVLSSRFLPWLDSNHLSFLTGLLFGSSINVLFFPIFNYFFCKNRIYEPAVKNWKKYILLLGILAIIFLIHFIKVSLIFSFIGYASVIGLIAVYLMINTFLSTLIIGWKRRKINFRAVLLLIFLIILLFFGEIMLFTHSPVKF